MCLASVLYGCVGVLAISQHCTCKQGGVLFVCGIVTRHVHTIVAKLYVPTGIMNAWQVICHVSQSSSLARQVGAAATPCMWCMHVHTANSIMQGCVSKLMLQQQQRPFWSTHSSAGAGIVPPHALVCRA